SSQMTLGVALVTGAGRGIGRAIALRLAKDGFNIALNDIRQTDGLEDLKKEIKKTGREAFECIADVSKEVQVRSMVDATVNQLGGLDVMVANAGICVPKPFMEGNDLLTLYCATKFAVRSLTQSAALALKPHGITVNAYAPGLVDTAMVANLREDMKNFVEPSMLDATYGQMGSPDQIAKLVSYLACKEAQFITGKACTSPLFQFRCEPYSLGETIDQARV
ncbi:Diacetyl reductase [(S)-acetoin forming], partial [Leucoagaricus sp. SymC.cos]